jgi:deazaflavin-dependent oxidoreductase (nitroreductase family)
VVVSGFGTRAQWFRNIEADDRVRVWVGARSAMRAGARRLGPEDASIALGRYAEARPRAWSALRPVLEQTLGAHIDEDGTELPMVALELAGRPDAGA